MVEDALAAWTPFRSYDEHNVREQYLKHIRPRFVNSKKSQLALKSAVRPWVPPPVIIPLRSVTSTKFDTEAIVPLSTVSSIHLETEKIVPASPVRSINVDTKDTTVAREDSGPFSSTMITPGPNGRPLVIGDHKNRVPRWHYNKSTTPSPKESLLSTTKDLCHEPGVVSM